MPSAKWRAANPIKASYLNAKSNAKKRDIAFELTFEQYRRFVQEHNYMNSKGRSRDSLHIDRIDASKGYVISNLQVLTNSENVKKQWNGDYTWYWCEIERKMVYKYKKKSTPDFSDVPF